MSLKSLLITSSFCAGAFMLGACAKDLGIKVYMTDVDKKGLYRAQDDELIKWENADGYYCTNSQGMRKLVEAYRLCKDLQPND